MASPRSGKILVVDDDIESLRITGRILESRELIPILIQGPEQALKLINDDNPNEIDAIICDYCMDEMTGTDLIDRIRERKRLHIPAIIYTGFKESVDNSDGRYILLQKDDGAKALLRQLELLLPVALTQDDQISSKEFSKRLLTKFNVDELLGSILDNLGTVIPFDSASIMLIQDKKLYFAAQKGFRSEEQYLKYDDLNELKHIRELLNHPGHIIIDDTSSDSRWHHEPDSDYIKSWLGLSLTVNDIPIGILNIDRAKADGFTESDIGPAERFAEYASIAIENAKLFTRIENSSNYLNILIESSFDAVIAIDERKLISVFNKKAEELFMYSSADVIGKENVAFLHSSIDSAKHIYELIREQGEIANFQADLKKSDGTFFPALISAQQLTDSDGNSLGQVGFIKDLLQAQRMENRLRLLNEATKAVNSQSNMQEVKAEVMNLALEAFPGAEWASIHSYNEILDMLIPAHTNYEDINIEEIENLKFKPGKGIAGCVFDSKKPLLIPDAAIDKRYIPMEYPGLEEHRSLICAPLLIGEKCLGALTISSTTKVDFFDKSDLELLMVFADHVAIAMNNFNILTDAQYNSEKRKGLLEISELLNGEFDIGKQFQHCEEFLINEMHASIAYIGIYHELTGQISFPIAFEEGKRELLEPISLDDAEGWGITGNVVHTSEGLSWFSEEERTIILESRGIEPNIRGIKTKTAVFEPLMIGDKNLGVISIQSDKEYFWNQIDIEVFQTFVNQLAISIRNTNLFEAKTQSQTRVQEAFKASQKVAEAKTVEEVVNQIGDRAIKEMGADWAQVILVDENRMPKMNEIVFPGGREVPESISSGINSICLRVMDLNEADFITSHEPVEENLQSTLERETASSICLPLCQDQRILGVIWVHFQTKKKFNELEKETWSLFSKNASIALSRIELISSLENTQSTVKIAAHLSVLGINQRFLREIAEGVQKATNCDIVTLYTYEEDNQTLQFPPTMIGVHDVATATLSGGIRNDSPPYRILGRETLYTTSDTPNDGLVGGEFTRREQVIATAGIPLAMRGKNVGVMFVNYRRPHSFSTAEISNLELFSNQIAVAIHNNQLYETLQMLNGYIGEQTVFNWIKLWSDYWNHKIAGTVGNLKSQISLAKLRITKGADSKEIETLFGKLTELANDFSAKLVEAPLTPEDRLSSVDINELIAKYINTQRKILNPDEPISFELSLDESKSEQARVYASREWLRRVFVIIIENAVEALSKPNLGERKIRIRSECGEEDVQIWIQDTGPGYPETLLASLGNERVPKGPEETGSGVGLIIAKSVLQLYGGMISFFNDKGAVVEITLPLYTDDKE